MDKILQEKNYIKSCISQILLIGGSTFIKKIRDIISKKFPNIVLNESKIEPFLAVSKGAAILGEKIRAEESLLKEKKKIETKGAAILGDKIRAVESGLNEKKKIENIYLLDITNLPLGVEVLGQKMSTVVEKNTKIPNTNEKIFKTVKNNQTTCDINIYEGEKDKVKDNFNLGNFSIKNLPKKKAGDAMIRLKFYIDDDSYLSVKAFDLSNEKK